MARSPDGTTVVSAAADETLRFWRIFGSPTRSASKLKDEQVSRLYSKTPPFTLARQGKATVYPSHSYMPSHTKRVLNFWLTAP